MLCFIFSELISQAAGALMTGLVISVLAVGLLFFVIKALADRSAFSIAGYGVGAVLFLFLCYHVIPACGAVALRWKCDEMELWLTQNVISHMSFSDVSEITPEESREVIDALVGNVPLVESYVEDLELAGRSAAAITSTVAGQIRSSLDSFVWQSVLWSLAGILIAGVIIYKTLNIRYSRTSGRYVASSGDDHRRNPVSSGGRRRAVSGGSSLRRR